MKCSGSLTDPPPPLQVNIAVVGEGTGKVLRAEGTATLQPMFVPSQVHL